MRECLLGWWVCANERVVVCVCVCVCVCGGGRGEGGVIEWLGVSVCLSEVKRGRVINMTAALNKRFRSF